MDEAKDVMAAVLVVATKLGDPDVAAGLLESYGLADVTPKAATNVARLLDRYGPEWFRALLSGWMVASRAGRRSEVTIKWLESTLVPVCRALSGRSMGEASARAILAAQWPWVQERLANVLKDTPAKARKAALEEFGRPLVALIKAAQIVQEKAIHRQILDFIAVADADLLPLQVAALRAGSGGKHNEVRTLGLAPVHARAMRTLTRQLELPERAADDWSIVTSLRCSCERCKVFKRYLASKSQVNLEWPLAAGDRQHIEHIIRIGDIPVSHALLQRGRPYTLVLQKTPELLKRADAERRSREQDVAWLKGIAKEF
jgi:hypothetical protein